MSGERFVVRLHSARDRARAAKALSRAPEGYVVRFDPPTRTNAQNARLWGMLSEVSAACEWHGERLTSEEWKDVFTAALRRQRVVPGLDGGLVMLGSRTSRMSKAELGELMDLIAAFCAQRGIVLTAEMELTP